MGRFLIILLFTVVLSPLSKASLPSIYYQLNPYHFKYCAETQYQMRGDKDDRSDDIFGIKTGHTVFYLNGVKISPTLSPKGKKYLELVDEKELKNNSKSGVGFSVNSIFKSSPFMMVSSIEDLLESPIAPEMPITKESLENLAEIAISKGYFDHIKFQLKNSNSLFGQLASKKSEKKDLVPIRESQDYTKEEKLKIARYTIGTDLFVNVGRSKTYCMNISLTKKMAKELMTYLNEAAENPQGGKGASYPGYISVIKKDSNYYDYHFLDHCGVLPRNALGELGVISKTKTSLPVIAWPIFEQFPLDTLLSLINKMKTTSNLYLEKYDYFYNNPGNFLEVIGMHQPNEIFMPNETIKGYGFNYLWGESSIKKVLIDKKITYQERFGLKPIYERVIKKAQKDYDQLIKSPNGNSKQRKSLKQKIGQWKRELRSL